MLGLFVRFAALCSELFDRLRQPAFLRFKRTDAFFAAAVRAGHCEQAA